MDGASIEGMEGERGERWEGVEQWSVVRTDVLHTGESSLLSYFFHLQV